MSNIFRFCGNCLWLCGGEWEIWRVVCVEGVKG